MKGTVKSEHGGYRHDKEKRCIPSIEVSYNQIMTVRRHKHPWSPI